MCGVEPWAFRAGAFSTSFSSHAGLSPDLLVPYKAMRGILTPKCLRHAYIVWYYSYMRLRNSLAG